MIPPMEIQMRFSDIDKMGHVNNAVYLNYFETARMHFLGQLLGNSWDWDTDGIILLKNEVEYVKPVLLEHRPLVYVGIEYIGNKSFSLNYRLEVDGELYCKGISLLVAYDYTRQSAQPIPEIMREKLEAYKQEQ